MMLVVPTWVTVDLGVDYGIEKNFTITFVVFPSIQFRLYMCVFQQSYGMCTCSSLVFSFSCSSYVCGRKYRKMTS